MLRYAITLFVGLYWLAALVIVVVIAVDMGFVLVTGEPKNLTLMATAPLPMAG